MRNQGRKSFDFARRCLTALFVWAMASTAAVAIEPRERQEAAAPDRRRAEPTTQAPIIDRTLSYDAQALRVAEAMTSGRLRTLRASARRVDQLDAALNAVRQSTARYTLHPPSVAATLEADQFWMTLDTPRPAATVRTVFVIQNNEGFALHGLVVRMSDQSCGFENLGTPTYFIIEFQDPNGGLPPSEIAAYAVPQSVPAWMFRSTSGANFCQTVVASF